MALILDCLDIVEVSNTTSMRRLYCVGMTQTDRQTDRQIDRLIDRQTDTETYIKTDTDTHTHLTRLD